MKINARERDGVTILEPKGKITIGVGDVALREAVHEAVNAGSTNILVNLKGVSTIDSSGIGELVAAYTTVSNKGGKLRLFGIPPKVNDILQITQLVSVFDVLDDEDEGVASFNR
jgi:anti-sigma B factor antagonist